MACATTRMYHTLLRPPGFLGMDIVLDPSGERSREPISTPVSLDVRTVCPRSSISTTLQNFALDLSRRISRDKSDDVFSGSSCSSLAQPCMYTYSAVCHPQHICCPEMNNAHTASNPYASCTIFANLMRCAASNPNRQDPLTGPVRDFPKKSDERVVRYRIAHTRRVATSHAGRRPYRRRLPDPLGKSITTVRE